MALMDLCQAPYLDAQTSYRAISGAAFDPCQARQFHRDVWMITPALIPSLADGESQKSLEKSWEPPALQQGRGGCSAQVSPAQGTPGCPLLSSIPAHCNLSHSYLEKCDLLPDGAEEEQLRCAHVSVSSTAAHDLIPHLHRLMHEMGTGHKEQRHDLGMLSHEAGK